MEAVRSVLLTGSATRKQVIWTPKGQENASNRSTQIQPGGLGNRRAEDSGDPRAVKTDKCTRERGCVPSEMGEK